MKIIELIEEADYNELNKLIEDISRGGKHIKKLIQKRMKLLEKEAKVCAVCGKPILFGDNSYSLEFGNDDFKKKAFFCATDCLEFFIKNVKKSNKDLKNKNL